MLDAMPDLRFLTVIFSCFKTWAEGGFALQKILVVLNWILSSSNFGSDLNDDPTPQNISSVVILLGATAKSRFVDNKHVSSEDSL